MTLGAEEFVEKIRELEWANSTILEGKAKREVKAMPPWLEVPCRPGKK